MVNLKLSLQQPKVSKPEIKIHIQFMHMHNDVSTTTAEAYLAPVSLDSCMHRVNAQIAGLSTADIEHGDSYTVKPEDDIITDLFDTSYQVGAATNFLLHTSHFMETEAEDVNLDVMKSVIPYTKIGTLEVHWQPITSRDDFTAPDIDELDENDDIVGKPWCYKVKLGKLKDLPFKITEAHVEFTFNGQSYSSSPWVDSSGSGKRMANINHEEIICLEGPEVTEEFVRTLDEDELKMEVHIKPYVNISSVPTISTDDLTLCARLGIHQGVKREDKVKKFQDKSNALEAETAQLKEGKFAEAALARIEYLKATVLDLEEKIGNKKASEMAKAQAAAGEAA